VSILVILWTWTSVSNTDPDLIWIRNPDSDTGRQKWLTKKEASLKTWKSFTEGREETSSIQINKIRFFQLLNFCYSRVIKHLGPDPDSTKTDLKPWHEGCFVSVGCLEERCCAACEAEVGASCLRQPPLSGGQQLVGIRHPLTRPNSTQQPNINTSTKAADIFHCCRILFKIKNE
jgi:hypothetical protein